MMDFGFFGFRFLFRYLILPISYILIDSPDIYTIRLKYTNGRKNQY